MATSDKLQARREEISRLEEKIRVAQAKLQEKRRALANEELLQIKAELDKIDIPFDQLMALLREIAEKGEADHEQDPR